MEINGKEITELVHVPTGNVIFSGGGNIDLMFLNQLNTPVRLMCTNDKGVHVKF